VIAGGERSELMSVDLKRIEEKWIDRWEEAGLFEADPEPGREKFFLTFPFPYMNGPLHIGHAFTSTKCDVQARFRRMQGYNVLFPWAWHLTGEPIAGAASRVRSGDEEQIRIFRTIDGVPEEEIERFGDPEYIARYYIRESKSAVRRLGHSIDWRREFHTTSLHPHFNRFIQWQYETLREKGFVKKGTHPVIWCPRCRSPTGDHDRLQGEGASTVEFTLLKFALDGAFLPAATLRPETLFGVVNMWLNPDAEYVRLRLGSEEWIVSREAARKLSEQKGDVEVVGELNGRELIGRECRHPLSGSDVLILPASFVDPDNSTGVVMSVPSHAPYDWIALKDLVENPSVVAEYGISESRLRGIAPVSLIRTQGLGEHPAIDICEKMGIRDQSDPRLEEATEIIYREEFYKGVLKENTGRYAGMKVSEVKKPLVAELEELGVADRMFETTEKVVCRCTSPCVVKIVKDQWFLTYSDEKWKELARDAIKSMLILPEEARMSFLNTIDWLEDKACARRTGMGTPLPWDEEWIVETLSDSTVYMAFYTIAKHVNAGKVPVESLTKEVFDYIFYGRGRVSSLAKEHGIEESVLRELREEFTYFMPVDFRNSAKELIPNHLTFYVFQHCALFPRELWPRAIAVNGMISIEGMKMSKSKGNFVTLKQVLDAYGSDTTRAALLYTAEGMRDPDWREKLALDMRSRLQAFHNLAMEIIGLEEDPVGERSLADRWLLSRMQRHIANATASYESDRTRTAFQTAFFDVYRDVRWYLRTGKPRRSVLMEALDIWVRLLAPVVPALAEEIWEAMGRKGFVSTAPWPDVREELVDAEAEAIHSLVQSTLEDVESILSVTKLKPRRVVLYTAEPWKWRVMEIVGRSGSRDMGRLMAEVAGDELARAHVKEASRFVELLLKERYKPGEVVRLDELRALQEFRGLFEGELGCRVEVYRADDASAPDPMGKAGKALPLKPAIYVE